MLRRGGFAAGRRCSAAANSFDPTIWYSVDRDGIITVNIIRAEMGQHVGTALARILADELEADWSKVRVNTVDTDAKWGTMVTGGSWSVWATFPVFSQAGAAGRIALTEAGAKLLGVPADQCQARNSSVVAADRSISYADIVSRADLTRTFTADELAKMPIKPASERRLIGRKIADLDIPAKTNGTAIYGIDANVAGMVYARPKIPPTRNGAKVRSIDNSAAKKVKGYISSLVIEDPSDTVPGWVLVFANSYPAAIRAADLVKVDSDRRQRRACLRAGCTRSRRGPDRQSERRRFASGRRRPRCRFQRRKLNSRANLHNQQRDALPARAG